MILKVKTSEELFNKFKTLSLSVRNLASIVQNDMEITTDQLTEWEVVAQRVREEFDNLIETTKRHVYGE
jgi:hypothetical protein